MREHFLRPIYAEIHLIPYSNTFFLNLYKVVKKSGYSGNLGNQVNKSTARQRNLKFHIAFKITDIAAIPFFIPTKMNNGKLTKV